jgi:shikimate kinase
LDDIIEKRTGKSPRALFTEGAEKFRAAEAEALAAVLRDYGQASQLVIALGGGIIDNEAAVALLKNQPHLKIIFLEISADEAWRRIESAAREGQGIPPFLDTPDPRKTHHALHTRRAAAYRSIADIIVDCENKNPQQIAGEAMNALSSSEFNHEPHEQHERKTK